MIECLTIIFASGIRNGESVDSGGAGGEYELVLHSADYFSGAMPDMNNWLIVKSVVVRFAMLAPGMR